MKPPKLGQVVMHKKMSRGQKAEPRATALDLIQSIVEKHGGAIEMDLPTGTLNIDVSEEELEACAQEIEKQVGVTLKMIRGGDNQF
jgi:dihydroxyacid dehydratase/phosphogluconate dehydratase